VDPELDQLRVRFLERRTPEDRLLLACMRQELDAAGRRRVAELSRAPGLDWRSMLRVAVEHQVAPLFLHQLASSDGTLPLVPADVLAALQSELARNLGAKAEMAGALGRVVAEFAAAGIDVLAVKGTALDLRLFADSGHTVSGDLDLVVRIEPVATDPPLRARIAELNRSRPVVDVHCGRHPDLVMNGVLRPAFAHIWEAARPVAVGGGRVFLMRVEHELLCACINSARKRFFRLKSLLELGELLRGREPIDWDEVARSARRWRCGGIAYAALAAVHAAVGAVPLPDRLRARFGVARAHARVLRWLVGRMSLCTLGGLYRGRTFRGKRLGRGLLLPYASLGARPLARALGVVARQVVAGPARQDRPEIAARGSRPRASGRG
jgi:hypothetical protein